MSAADAVPFVDLGRQHDELGAGISDAIGGVLDRGDFILGAAVERFETEFAAYLGAGHAIGVGSGTAALTIAALAAGLEPGDEMIVPAHTYAASAFGPLHAGAVPVFCDVDADTGLIDPDAAATAIGDRTAAILAVHLYGQACEMEQLDELASRHGLVLIEDAAQAHGASWAGHRAGSFGRAAAFSFYPSKNLGALGDGGMVVTDDDDVAALARQWRNLGQRGKGEHLRAGYNERLDTLHAAALSVKLPHLDAWNESRRQAASIYRGLIGDAIPTLPERDRAEDVWHLFPVRVSGREEVADDLFRSGIGTGTHYTPAVHRQPPFAADNPAGSFPAAEAWAAEELSLPMFPGIRRDEIERTVDALFDATGRG